MNRTISRYIEKNILYPEFIQESPLQSLGIVVVIPCFNEPDISPTLESLFQCERPKSTVEVILSINAGEKDSHVVKEQNRYSKAQALDYAKKAPEWLSIYAIVNNDLPTKKAGVGLGRKIGMDEAVLRFRRVENEEGILVCFDADSQCAPNYLVEIENHFRANHVASASIHYEHPIEGNSFDENTYLSIIQYELHLRYFIHMQRQLGLPFAFHTIGSSMACTVSAYCAVGGMNQRKAGEDFYFIHKLVKYGRHSNLNSTRVIPSPRVSDRVPFGTGKAIGDMLCADNRLFYSYHPQSFYDLEVLMQNMQEVYRKKSFEVDLPSGLIQFLRSVHAQKELERIGNNTGDFNAFKKKFWHWFDAFLLMKYLHFMRDLYYENLPVLEAVIIAEEKQFSTAREALIYFREIDIIS